MSTEESAKPANGAEAGEDCGCCLGGFFARRRARRLGLTPGPGGGGVVRGRTRRPFWGLLCGMLVMLGVPALTAVYGSALPVAVQLALIIGAFVAGGLMAIVSVAIGLIVPQMRFRGRCAEGAATGEK